MIKINGVVPEGSFYIAIEGQGVLDFCIGSRDVVFRSEYGEDRVFKMHPLAERPDKVEFAILSHCVVAALETGDSLFRFEFASHDLKWVCDFGRSDGDDHAFLFVRLIPVADCLLVVYESGLLMVSQVGELLWHVVHRTWGFEFAGIDTERVLYRDSDGNSWAYKLADGTEVRE